MKCPSCSARWNDTPAMLALAPPPNPAMLVMCSCGRWFRLQYLEPSIAPTLGEPLDVGWKVEEFTDWPGGMPPGPINACTRRYDDDGSSPSEALQRELAAVRQKAKEHERRCQRIDLLQPIFLALREAERKCQPLTLPQFGFPEDRVFKTASDGVELVLDVLGGGLEPSTLDADGSGELVTEEEFDKATIDALIEADKDVEAGRYECQECGSTRPPALLRGDDDRFNVCCPDCKTPGEPT